LNNVLEELIKYSEEKKIRREEIAQKLGVPYKTLQSWFATGKSHYEPSSFNQERIKRFLHPENQPTLNDIEPTTFEKKANQIEQKNTGSVNMRFSQQPQHGKTVRDPVQMDIELSPLEVKVIDTQDFQRLRHIKQLGAANLVFPGATHTRFEHSLGTLAVAQNMINIINNNPDTQMKIEGNVIQIIRMYALLHDITHIPFGHTIEDEGFLFPRHDNSQKNPRWEEFLGPSSDIGKILGEEFRSTILKYLTTSHDQINQLEYPFVIDLVANTVCADLIDYLSRDTTYSGLKETFDPRFLKYLLIASYKSTEKDGISYNKRVALSLLKQNRVRRDVISEVMHLLRLRYSLAEKIYFHHAKIVASAMIIEAMQAALIHNPTDFTPIKLCGMKFGDDELLINLRDKGGPIAKKLIEKLSARSLYKPVYMLTFSAPSTEDTSWDKKLGIIKKFKENHIERFNLERQLEKWNGLPEGSVIIYCPTEDMNLKEIETLCLWRDGQIMPLVKIPGEKLASEAKDINNSHKELWKLYVLVERGLEGAQEKYHNIASDCYHQFNLPNCIEEFCKVGQTPLERYIENWAMDKTDLHVTIPEKNELIQLRSINRERNTDGPPLYQDLEQDLRDIREKSKQ
jgi:uncharacterized protein